MQLLKQTVSFKVLPHHSTVIISKFQLSDDRIKSNLFVPEQNIHLAHCINDSSESFILNCMLHNENFVFCQIPCVYKDEITYGLFIHEEPSN